MYFCKRIIGLLFIALMSVVITVSATGTGQETLYLQKGETYSFTNTGEEVSVVTYDGDTDCIIYNADGSLESDYCWGEAEVPAGGKVVLTATEAIVDVTYSKDTVTVKKEERPCFEQVVLCDSIAYAFQNISGEERTLETNETSMKPYILYDAAGNIAEYDTTKSWKEMDIPAGYTLKLKGIDESQITRASFARGGFAVTKETQPIFDVTTIPFGDGYSFKNISGKSITLFSDGGVRDWRLSDANGAIVGEAIGDKWGTAGEVKKEIPAGHTIELTATHPIDVHTIRGTFQIQKVQKPVVRWIYVLPGDTYSFTNKTDSVRNIVEYNHSATDMQKDWVIFDSDGNVVSQHVTETWSGKTIAINPGHTIKVTPRFRNMPVGIFTDEFDYKHEDTPVFSRNVLIAGDKYSFKNISGCTQKMAGTNYVAYELYNAAGTMIGSSESAKLDTISVGAGETLHITTSGESMALYDAFEVKKVSGSEESEYFDVEYGKTYKLKNTNSSRYTLYTKDTGITYDYISYYASGKMNTSGGGINFDLSIEPSAYVLISFHANTSFYHSPVLEIEELEGPLFDRWILEPYKIYSFENINGEYGISSGFWAPAMVVNYSEGYDYPTSCDVTTGIGESKDVVEMKAFEGTLAAVHGKLKCATESEIAYAKAEFARGESGRVTNNSDLDCWMDFSGYMDEIRYPKDMPSYLELRSDSYFYAPAEGYVEFTAVTDVCFWYPVGMVTVEKITTPIVDHFNAPVGQTTLIKNTGSSSATVVIMTDNCDYVTYDENGKIKTGSADNGLSYEYFQKTFTLNANEQVAVTAHTSDLLVVAPKGTVSVEERDYPVYYNGLVMPGESFAYKNIQDGEIAIDCPVGRSVKYVIYNKNDIVEKDKTGYLYSLELSAGYRVEVTEIAEPMVFSGFYEIMRNDIIFMNDFRIAKDGDGGTVKISAYNIPKESTVLTAVYDKDNKIIDVKALEIDTNGLYSADVSLKDATECKAFVWGETASLGPLCEEGSTNIAE